MLAWVRTGLGVFVVAFMLKRLDGWLRAAAPAGAAVERSVGTVWIGAAFVVFGLLTSVLAILRFARSRRALRMGAPLPKDIFQIAFAAGFVLGGALAIYVIAKRA